MAKKTPALIDVGSSDIFLRTYILFLQTADVVYKYSDTRFFEREKLSTIRYGVLITLDMNGGTMTPSRLAMWLFKEPHSITMLAQRLKKEGLVSIRRQTKNRRSVNITLTAKGREVLEKATPTAKEIAERVTLSISKEDVAQLGRLLGILRQNAHNSLEELTCGSQT